MWLVCWTDLLSSYLPPWLSVGSGAQLEPKSLFLIFRLSSLTAISLRNWPKSHLMLRTIKCPQIPQPCPASSNRATDRDIETKLEARWHASPRTCFLQSQNLPHPGPSGKLVSPDPLLPAWIPACLSQNDCSEWKIWQIYGQNNLVHGTKVCICGSERKLSPLHKWLRKPERRCSS